MPKDVNINVDNVPQDGSGSNPSMQSYLKYTIDCPNPQEDPSTCDGLANTLTVAGGAIGLIPPLDFLASIFSVAGASLTAACG